MKAVILAAGKGERMLPITKELPKPLVKVGGQTFLDHIFDSLPEEVGEVIVVIGYQGEKIKKYLGGRYKGKKVEYAVQSDLSGTAVALLAAKPFLSSADERFLVFYGDELPSREEVREVLAHHFSLLCHPISRKIATGVVETDSDKRILQISERPEKIQPPILASGGVMLLGPAIFEIPLIRHRNGEYYLTSVLNEFLKQHPVFAVIGSPDLYFITAADVDKFGKKL